MNKTLKIILIIIGSIITLITLTLITIFLGFRVLIGTPLNFSEVNSKNTPYLYKLEVVEIPGISSQVPIKTLYYTIDCDMVDCLGDPSKILISESAEIKNDKIINPTLDIINNGTEKYYIFKENGGTDGYGSNSYKIIKRDSMGMLSEIETPYIFNTCEGVNPVYKNNRIYFPKSGKCSDLGFNSMQYLNVLDSDSTQYLEL